MISDKVPNFDPLELRRYKSRKLTLMHKKFSDLWVMVTQSKAPKRIFSISFLLWAILIGFLPGYLVHREIYFQENLIRAVMDEDRLNWDNEEEIIKPTYKGIIENYETVRRYTFSQFSDQNDESISDFINANHQVVSQAFADPVKNKSTMGSKKLPIILMEKFFFLLIILIVFWLLFKLIMYLTHRIFLSDVLFTDIKKNPAASSRNNFIVCLNNQKALEWISENFDLKIKPEMVFDLRNVVQENGIGKFKEKVGNGAIIMENFHVLTQRPDFIDLLSRILKEVREGTYLFIVSGISFKDSVNRLNEADALLFSELLSTFISYTVSIESKTAIEMIGNFDNNGYIKLLNKEFRYGHDPQQVKSLILHELTSDNKKNSGKKLDQETFEKCILKIQRFNKAYYTNIWLELSFREKKMVYYLAKEGFVNFANKEILTLLLEKGIIVLKEEENGLEIFTYSFKNFVNQIITTDLNKSFLQDEKRFGNSGNIQTAAISFVFISIAVISYYDPNILNKTSAYVSAVIGLAGTVFTAFNRGMSYFTRKIPGHE